jgi:hypothetical protein
MPHHGGPLQILGQSLRITSRFLSVAYPGFDHWTYDVLEYLYLAHSRHRTTPKGWPLFEGEAEGRDPSGRIEATTVPMEKMAIARSRYFLRVIFCSTRYM